MTSTRLEKVERGINRRGKPTRKATHSSPSTTVNCGWAAPITQVGRYVLRADEHLDDSESSVCKVNSLIRSVDFEATQKLRQGW